MHSRWIRLTSRGLVLLCSLLALSATASARVPGVAVWDGGGADATWLDAANWVGNVLPHFGRYEELIFGTGFDSGRVLQMAGNRSTGMLLIDAQEGFAIAGDRLVLHEGEIVRSADSSQDHFILADVDLRGGGHLRNESDSDRLVLSGSIRGGPSLTIDGGGRIDFQGSTDNRYSGTTFVNEGTLVLKKRSGAQAIPGKLVIGDGKGDDFVALLKDHQIRDSAEVLVNASGRLFLEGHSELFRRLTVDEGFVSAQDSELVVRRPLTIAAGETYGEVYLGSFGAMEVPDKVTSLASPTTAYITGGTFFLTGMLPTFKVADGPADVDLSVSANIAGYYGLIKKGEGLLELASPVPNVYDGLTLVEKGVLRLTGGSSPGSTFGWTEVFRGCSLEMDSASVADEALILHGCGFRGTGALRGVAGESTWSGDVLLAGGVSIGAEPGASLFVSGTIVGDGGLKKLYRGVLSLSGDTANTYSGTTRVQGGTLVLDKTPGLPAVPGKVEVGDGIGKDRLQLAGSHQIPDTAKVGVHSSGTMVLTDNVQERIRKLSIDRGAVSVGTGRLGVAEGIKFVGGNASIDPDGTLRLEGNLRTEPANNPAIVSGGKLNLGGRTRNFNVADGPAGIDLAVSSRLTNGALTKTGSGTLTLTGESTYHGQTRIEAGVLEIVGSLHEASTITVKSNATLTVNSADPVRNFIDLRPGSTLAGTGTIATALAVGRNVTIAPGNSPGTLTFTKLTLDPQSVLQFELQDPAVVGGGVNDLIQVNGDLVLDGVLNVTGLDGFNGGTYQLVSYGGLLTDHGLQVGVAPPGHHYRINTDIPGLVTLTVMPEPTVLAVLVVGAAAVLLRRRRSSLA